MPDIIRLLPDSLANQIAAGEVVQRPASVVKELLENSVDAGASQVQLIVKDAGKTLVQVVDDGCGMTPTDARMCFERHATSKIASANDLFNIRSFGFRGEAMASIAAVAQLELKTRPEADTTGTLVEIEGSKVLRQEPCATAKGTSIQVKNLFFNVPARRNFLKSNPVELRHILEEFQRVALPNPETAFALFHNDLEVYQLRKGNLAQRIAALFGKGYKEMLLPCQEEVSDLRVWGYVGKPEAAKKTRGEQFFFANQRFIKHGYLHHAVMSAYEGLLAADTFPFYVLMIDIDPTRIDVNVHPTKTEIKFDDERSVYALVQAAVRQALGRHHLAPAIDFDLDANFKQPGRLQAEEENRQVSPAEYEALQRYAREKNNLRHWQSLYPDEGFQQKVAALQATEAETQSEIAWTMESDMNAAPASPTPVGGTASGTTSGPAFFQLHQRYMLSQVKSGLMVVDQQAAHERILYEKMKRGLSGASSNQLASQRLLFPQRLRIGPADFAVLQSIGPDLRSLGFEFELLAGPPPAVMLTGVPADLPPQPEDQLLEALLTQYAQQEAATRLSPRDELMSLLARRAAVKHGTALAPEAMQALIDQLFACENPNYTPKGQKIFTVVNLDTLESLF